MGKAQSGTADSAGFTKRARARPVRLGDLPAPAFKVGRVSILAAERPPFRAASDAVLQMARPVQRA